MSDELPVPSRAGARAEVRLDAAKPWAWTAAAIATAVLTVSLAPGAGARVSVPVGVVTLVRTGFEAVRHAHGPRSATETRPAWSGWVRGRRGIAMATPGVGRLSPEVVGGCAARWRGGALADGLIDLPPPTSARGLARASA